MHEPSKQDREEIDMRVQYLLILQVASDDEGRTREQLYAALGDIDRDAIDEAIESLQRAEVLIVRGERLHKSPALERIDRLDMIGA